MTEHKAPKPHLFNLTLHGMEELGHFQSAEERQRALEEVGHEVRLRDLAVGIALCALATFGAFTVVRLMFQYVLPSSIPAWLAEASCYAGAAMSMFFTLRFLHRWGTARELRKKLIISGVPVCLSCGYKLTGLPARSETCPECGKALDIAAVRLLQVHKDSPGLASAIDDPQPPGPRVVP